ncbi:hypothetical protein CQ14_29635 [Bradyrhizobium lablabi]|uniref:Uncharacterized protein n=1 Tax=Bradyrhizobium lablabi TaxID=722472 RepID=A0A0R3MQ37_9BRAD|nr:hypothetical protein CQ14_29635 [Bradyrhizobium lablabi]
MPREADDVSVTEEIGANFAPPEREQLRRGFVSFSKACSGRMFAQVILDVRLGGPHNCDPSNVTAWSQVQHATSEAQQEGPARQ